MSIFTFFILCETIHSQYTYTYTRFEALAICVLRQNINTNKFECDFTPKSPAAAKNASNKMPPRDSQASYVHLKNSHHVLYMSNWVRDKLPFDPVEALELEIADDQESTTLQNAAFGSLKSSKKRNEPVWKDLELHRLISDDLKQAKGLEDPTLLAKLDRIHESRADFFEEGNSSMDSSFLQNTSSSSLPSIEITTPEMSRTRPQVGQRSATRDVQSFQTPIGRIMR